tara:strand:- start:22404 stop:23171 length:768 start_codon:yes stop_codon:yes gene_type:complete
VEKNNLIWISGGSTGIGRATAKKFAKEGWSVAISARSQENLISLKNEIINEYNNNKIHTYVCDNRDTDQVRETILNIEKNLGHIEIALMNAGTTHPYSKEFNLDYYKHVINTNIIGTLNCINSIYPIFKKRKKGHLSIVSSMVGFRGLPTASAYTMSKAALINLAESLYFDLKKIGVRVTLINPGFIKTPLTDKNTFPMPFLKSSEFAAEKIYQGLVNSNKFELIFPFQWFLIMKLLRILPYRLYFYFVSKFTGL